MNKKDELIILARNNFWWFCKVRNPKFYKDSRPHLKRICDTLQALYEGRIIRYIDSKDFVILSNKELQELDKSIEYEICKKLQLNLPPGHGKSYTVQLFSEWCFGKNIDNEIITVSYNEKLSESFGKAVRDGIEEVIEDVTTINYSDIFPHIKIKYGSASKSNWSLEGRHHSYLATSFNGTLTGMRGNIAIIDDPVKDDTVAYNINELENQWKWYCDTFISRVLEGGIQIVIQTRWSKNDLCGKLLEAEPNEWYVLLMQAYDKETDTMLCDELMSKKSYESKKKLTSPEIFLANYQQITIDVQNRLYSTIKTYEDIPRDNNNNPLFERIIAYVDTADTGNDYLCAIVAGIYNGEGYILDVYYTQDGMEITEPKTAELLYKNNVNIAFIESNNGGRGFARNVERNIFQKYKTRKVTIKWFHQSKNKISRILSNSSFVMEHIYFPINWSTRFPEFYEAIMSYSRKGKNKHDDACDCLTGIAEKIDSKKGMRVLK